MHRLFIGIYGSVLLAILFVLALSYASFSTLNEYRYKQHMSHLMAGTSYLLSSGVNRQEPEDQLKWLNLVSSLLGVKLQIEQDSDVTPGQIISVDSDDRHAYQLYTALQNNKNLTIELTNVTEHLLNGTAFLVLNELGRYPVAERQQQFEKLQSTFSFPLKRMAIEQVNFDSEQLERLARGETVAMWRTELGKSSSVEVYAPWGNSRDTLKLGSIKMFDPYPTWLLTLGLLIALVFLAIWVMVIIRKLSSQLTQLQVQVDSIEPEYLNESADFDSNMDIVSALKWKIDSMSQRIERLLDQKSYMIRAVSHDLRTPLSKAQFRLESLAMELGDDHKMLLATKTNLNQLNLMIDELLSYEKLSQNKTLSFEHLDITQLVRQIVLDTQVVYPKVCFEFTSETSGAMADINPALFTRMLENLLNNAGRYSKAKVQVSLVVDKENSTVELSVHDDGEGISDAAKEFVFDPFFQEEQSRSNKPAGYGLGLAIVKQIVAQHNASISLKDSNLGAHFVVSLPLQQREAL